MVVQKKGANKGETDSLHFPEHSDHLSGFHVADELHEFVVEVDEEDVDAIDPPLSQFLKSNPSHRFSRSMTAYSQLKVSNEEAQGVVPIENLQ